MSTSDNTQQELLKCSVQKLKKQCKSLKISTEGGKMDMIDRIINKMNESALNEESQSISTSTTTKSTKRKLKYTSIHVLTGQIQEWMEHILDRKFKLNFFEEIKTGMVLCELLNKIKPGTCYKYEKSDRAYIQKRNVEIYLSGCRALGIHKNNCFKEADLVINYMLKSNQRQIINNLHAVIKAAKKLEIDAKHIEINLNAHHSEEDDDDDQEIKENSELALISSTSESIQTKPRKKKKRGFKLVDDTIDTPTSMTSMSFSVENSVISYSKRSSNMTILHKQNSETSDYSDITEPVSDDSYMDTKCYKDKELLLSGYLRKYDKFIRDTVSLFCIGDVGSVYWSLTSTQIQEFLDKEEGMLQHHKQLVLGNGTIAIDVAISHNDDIISFTVSNANKIDFVAYIYCKCINNGCIVKKVYNAKKGSKNMIDIDLMDVTIWQKQNELKFEKLFISLNESTRKSAKYFRIPTFNDKLQFMFYSEILSVYNTVTINKQIEYKWNNINKIQIEKQNGIFNDVEIYSDDFGHDDIEYNKCWTLYAKYDNFWEQFYFSLKLLKLPLQIKNIKIISCLNIDGEQYKKTKQIDLTNNYCEWDTVRIDPQCLNQKNINISIEIIEANDNKSNLIQKNNWNKYGII